MTDDTTHFLTIPIANSLPTVNHSESVVPTLGDQIAKACKAWLMKSPSRDTRSNYERDIKQFLVFAGIEGNHPEQIVGVRPEHVSAWRDQLQTQGLTNSSVRRKMTALRSLFSYLQNYGYTGTNPAHGDFVQAPSAPRDGKTVGLTPANCRRLLDAPVEKRVTELPDGLTEESTVPVGIRDRALFAVLAYTGCRVGELVRLKVGSYKSNGVHKVLEIYGKGGKERVVPLHKEAEERLEAWLDASCWSPAGTRDQIALATQRPTSTSMEVMRLVRHTQQKGLQAHTLPMTCIEYDSVIDASGHVDFLLLLHMVTDKLAEVTTGLLANGNGVIVYGGALHNDLYPRWPLEQLSYAKTIARKLDGKVLEIDLVVPEVVAHMNMIRSEPWFPLLGRASPKRVSVWQRGPASYVVILPAQSEDVSRVAKLVQRM